MLLNLQEPPATSVRMSSEYSVTPQELYLDLMKQCLTYFVWGEAMQPLKASDIRSPFWRRLFPLLMRRISRTNILLLREVKFDPVVRADGLDHPLLAHTMIGLKRLDNIQVCIENVLRNGVPGDLIETGVWRGGATIFMRAALKAYQVEDRRVWVADSFEGLPLPNPDKYPADKGDKHYAMSHLAVSLDQVKANFAKYGLLDDQVCFLKGWFKNTLPQAPIERLALMRLDGDMYESTMDALTHLYPKLSVGGYVIIDDYGYIDSCRQAVHDFRQAQQIRDEIKQIDWSGVYWQRSR
jgi:O-methyltransferase